jgi:hypothetical protein
MAIESAIRWQLIRDVIVHEKSGVIVAQTGTNYLNWCVEKGKLVCVTSTFPEASLTQFLQKIKLTESTKFLTLQNRMDDSTAIGALLIRHHVLEEAEFRELLFQHWVASIDYLLDPSIHLFWSVTTAAIKPEIIRNDKPLAEVILKANKNSISIPTALRTVQQLRAPYRIGPGSHPCLSTFTEVERRIWMYLQSGSSLKQMFQDRDIMRIPCYKFLFLLWLSGSISDSQRVSPKQQEQIRKVSISLLEKIPPEWVFPLCAGALIGVLLAPAPEPKISPQQQPSATTGVMPLDEALQKPAWSSEQHEDINTEAQRHRDDEDQ